jgi:serine/threonine protein kinase/formylglycine-generating enzyme required for sulfatase activity
MATVYKARDATLDRDVAVKIIRREAFPPDQFDTILKRFEREAKSMAGLLHPNIVGVIDYGVIGDGEYKGLPYLVMVYLPGGTLKERLGKPFPWREAVRLLIPIARALEYTHEKNIINRDIKPSNILFTEKNQPMLTDFGLVKIFEGKENTNLTASGAGIGTPDYMAPEQWIGETTALSDMYSLGVVLYEMITGHRPYKSDTPAGVLLKQVNEPLPFPKDYIPDLPYNVEAVLLKVLAKDPVHRYPGISVFANELQNLIDDKEVTATTIKYKRLREQMLGKTETPLPQPEKDQAKETPAETTPSPQAEPARMDASPSKPLPAQPKRKFPTLVILFGALVLLAGTCGALWFVRSMFITATPPAQEMPIPPAATDPPAPEITPTALIPTEAPAPVETALPAEILDGKGVPMRLVPAGEFTMGNDEGSADERPASKIFVETFYIDKYEVTNEMYAACVSDGVCRLPEKPGSSTRTSYYNNPFFANYPVLYVNWTMAGAYCEWRGARLPTEAEWEKAARGAEDQRAFPWGYNFSCDLANHSGCMGDTAPVDQYEGGQSPYGVYGMSGNVWEWTSSLFSFYPYNAMDGRENPATQGNRVVRGGSWHIFGGSGGNIRIDTRFQIDPTYFGAYVGFRCTVTK